MNWDGATPASTICRYSRKVVEISGFDEHSQLPRDLTVKCPMCRQNVPVMQRGYDEFYFAEHPSPTADFVTVTVDFGKAGSSWYTAAPKVDRSWHTDYTRQTWTTYDTAYKSYGFADTTWEEAAITTPPEDDVEVEELDAGDEEDLDLEEEEPF